jgi:hypothetical protein
MQGGRGVREFSEEIGRGTLACFWKKVYSLTVTYLSAETEVTRCQAHRQQLISKKM